MYSSAQSRTRPRPTPKKGTLNSSCDDHFYTDLGHEAWTARYEDLRRQVLNPGATPSAGSWGQALVIGSGLVAWMEAWPRPTEAPRPLPGSGRATTPTAMPEAGVPPLLRPQAVHILVNMILALRKEVHV